MTTFAGFGVARTAQGAPVLWRQDRRFKTFRIELHARRPLDERAAARSLLPSLLLQGTRSAPDRPALARRMEELYGASVLPGTYKRGATHVLRMALDTVSGEFLPGRPDQLGESLELLAEQIGHPRLAADGRSFPADVFELERREHLADLRALRDDKGTWAQVQAISFACEGETIAIRETGTIETVRALSAADPETARRDFLEHGLMHFVAVGAVPDDERALVARVEEFVRDLGISDSEDVARPEAVARRPVRRLVERAPGMQQAKLVIVFRLPPDPGHERHTARRLMDRMFGGGPQSRLFREVREKRSLAYYAQSGYDRYTNLLVVSVGCDAANAELVEEETLAQLRALAQGEFEDRELEAARAQMTARLARIDDSLGTSAMFASEQWLQGDDRTPQAAADQVASTPRDEIARAAGEVWLDAVYLLAPEETGGESTAGDDRGEPSEGSDR